MRLSVAVSAVLLLCVLTCVSAIARDEAETRGEDLRQQGRYAQAIQAFEQALERYRAAHDVEGQLRTLIWLGTSAAQGTMAADAVRWLELARPLSVQLHDRASEGMILQLLGVLQEELGHFELAIEAEKAALVFSRERHDVKVEGDLLNALGRACLQLKQHAAACTYFEQALPLLHQVGSVDEGTTLLFLGNAYIVGSRFDAAIEKMQQALSFFRAHGDRFNEASALNMMGTTYNDMSRFDQAVSCLQQALAISKTAGYPTVAANMANLGSLYLRMGENTKAAEQYEEALALARQGKNRALEGTTLCNLGMTYSHLGRMDDAVARYKEALAIERELGDFSGQGEVLGNLGSLLCEIGRYSEALETLRAGLECSRKADDRVGTAYRLMNIGFANLRQDRLDPAQAAEEQALSLLQEVGDPWGQAAALDFLARIYEKKGNPRAAICYLKMSVNLFQGIRGQMRTFDRVAQMSFVGQVAHDYRHLAHLLIDRGRLPEAQQVLGFLKSSEYKSFTRGADGSSGALALTPQEQDLQKRYQAVAGRLVALSTERQALMQQPDRSKVMDRLLAIEKDMQTARGEFELFLKQLGTQLAHSEGGGEKLAALKNMSTLQEELRALGPGVALVYTIVGDDTFQELLVTSDLCKTYAVKVAAEDVNRKVLAFRMALQRPERDPRSAGKDLYDIVLSPALVADLQALKAKTVMWSLDGTLRYVPVNALWDGKRYLVEAWNNAVFTFATEESLGLTPSASWRIAALGVSKSWSPFPPLPGVPEELRSIVKTSQNAGGVLPGTMELDPDFTEKALEVAILGRNPVIHIASHFNFEPGDDSKSFLLLGNGQRLSVEDMKGFDFEGVDLLTLSACDTANGGEGQGSEIESFATLAQRHKARAVIASLWAVADQSTPLLMADFYRTRAEHPSMSKIEALQAAQLHLLHGEGGAGSHPQAARQTRGVQIVGQNAPPRFDASAGAPYAHPFYWAPFILIGNWK